MSRFVTIVFCIIVLICGCTSQSPEKLADYPSLTKNFTEQEVSDLQELLD